jgi:hypothetical protein
MCQYCNRHAYLLQCAEICLRFGAIFFSCCSLPYPRVRLFFGVCVCKCTRTYACMYVCLCICTDVHVCSYVCSTYASLFALLYACMYVRYVRMLGHCWHGRLRVYVHVYVHIRMQCIHMYTNVYTYMYVYLCLFKSRCHLIFLINLFFLEFPHCSHALEILPLPFSVSEPVASQLSLPYCFWGISLVMLLCCGPTCGAQRVVFISWWNPFF